MCNIINIYYSSDSGCQEMDLRSSIKSNLFRYLCILVFIGAFVVITAIALLSEFGVHPDEYDVRACLDWGMNHFIWPDMRIKGIGLGDTYSLYGYTKLSNYTPYFLIAGKIAYVFKCFMGYLPYYRMPNLLLALFITLLNIKEIKRKPYVILGFGICVQAWYIFSYVTADAQDFLLTYLSILLLADPDSPLWRTLGVRGAGDHKTEGIDRKDLIACVILGLLYGLILLGKPYYYANLVLTFIVVIQEIIKTKVNKKKYSLIKGFLILGVCLIVWLARAGLDFYYYGMDKSSIEIEMAEEYASADKKPSTPPEEQDVTWRMASKGYTLADFFDINDDWFIKSFRSFAGARITVEGEELYFAVIALLYIALYIMIGLYAFREGNSFIFITGTLLGIGGIAASVINSYMVDSQPQGRYLLPIVLTTCYLASLSGNLWKNRLFKAVVLAAAFLSLMYFGLVDIRKLIDLSYVRELLSL